MASKKVRLKVRDLRRKKRLTQQQIARKASLSKTTISNLESGKQNKIELETIGKLCEALDCSPNDIFEFERDCDLAIVQKQKKALQQFIGVFRYRKPFSPRQLDEDLAKSIHK